MHHEKENVRNRSTSIYSSIDLLVGQSSTSKDNINQSFSHKTTTTKQTGTSKNSIFKSVELLAQPLNRSGTSAQPLPGYEDRNSRFNFPHISPNLSLFGSVFTDPRPLTSSLLPLCPADHKNSNSRSSIEIQSFASPSSALTLRELITSPPIFSQKRFSNLQATNNSEEQKGTPLLPLLPKVEVANSRRGFKNLLTTETTLSAQGEDLISLSKTKHAINCFLIILK